MSWDQTEGGRTDIEKARAYFAEHIDEAAVQRVIAESAEWKTMSPLIAHTCCNVTRMIPFAAPELEMQMWKTLGGMVQSMYALGIERGKKEAQLQKFIQVEEWADEDTAGA